MKRRYRKGRFSTPVFSDTSNFSCVLQSSRAKQESMIPLLVYYHLIRAFTNIFHFLNRNQQNWKFFLSGIIINVVNTLSKTLVLMKIFKKVYIEILLHCSNKKCCNLKKPNFGDNLKRQGIKNWKFFFIGLINSC